MAQIDTTARDRFVTEYARGLSITEAAAAASISRRSAYRLIEDPEVRADAERTRADIRRRVVDVLATASTDAATVLHQIATNPESSDTARVAAARALLSETRNYVEVEELRQRIEAIEAGRRTITIRSMVGAELAGDGEVA